MRTIWASFLLSLISAVSAVAQQPSGGEVALMYDTLLSPGVPTGMISMSACPEAGP
jgi:hypothetical protein